MLPAGYVFNLDGSTLYLAVAAIFVAQAAGVRLSLAQQLPIMLTLMLTSKGVAAVPRAALSFSGHADHIRAAVGRRRSDPGGGRLSGHGADLDHLVGNCLAAAVMARWEGEFRPPALAFQAIVTD